MHKINKRGLSVKNTILLWVLGIAGQLCWNIENQWFNVYVYDLANGDYEFGTNVISYMIIFSALFTAFSTFLFGTWSDRIGKRKPFIAYGYIIWGIFTFFFGITGNLKEFVPLWGIGTIIVLADSIMSFFGSMGNDTGFSAWTTDLLDENSKGAIGIAIASQPVIGTIAGTVLGGIVAGAFIDTFIGGKGGYGAYICLIGLFILIIGIIALFTMKDVPNIEINKNGSFWHQFISNFNFKRFFKIKELVLVSVLLATFFIGFNCFFNYIGNLFIYNYGFDSANFGYIEGVALMFAVIVMIVLTNFIKKDRAPLMSLIAIISEILGLILLTVISKNSMYDPSSFICKENLVMIVGVLLVGFGYVTFMQTVMVWAKSLYPSDVRGQFEGIKVISFVLIPMIFGSLISKFLINNFGKTSTYFDSQANMEITSKVPDETLFIAAIIFIVLSLIPLYFVSKLHKKRINNL